MLILKQVKKHLTSSGQITSLKLNKSSGSGNSVLHVFGKFNSLISEKKKNNKNKHIIKIRLNNK